MKITETAGETDELCHLLKEEGGGEEGQIVTLRIDSRIKRVRDRIAC